MAHALHASAFAGAKVAPTRAARSSASTGRKSVVTRAMAAKTLSIPKTFEDLKKRAQARTHRQPVTGTSRSRRFLFLLLLRFRLPKRTSRTRIVVAGLGV